MNVSVPSVIIQLVKRVGAHKRWVLLNPGPVNVTGRVRRALLRPDICHREIEFSNLLHSLREKILKIFGVADTHTVAVFSGSGTTALEAMLSSFVRPDQKILVLSNGVYGDRIKSILEIHQSSVLTLKTQIGDFPSLAQIETLLKKDPLIYAIAMVHHETSSGMLNPLSEVGTLARRFRKLFLVDAISSLGAEPIDFKKTFIDALAGTSGKCLHGVPGASFVIVSKKALSTLKDQKPRTLYLDLQNTLDWEEKGESPFTPAVHVLYAFHEALCELETEGLRNRIKNYRKKSELLEKGFEKLGLRFLVQKKFRSHVLTALWMPQGISYRKMHDALKKNGFVIYAGQSLLKDKIFRVSNLGDVSRADLDKFLICLKDVLRGRR